MEEFFDLFQEGLVERIVHTSWSKNANIAFVSFQVIFGDDQTAAVNLLQEILLADKNTHFVGDVELFENIDKVIMFFEDFNDLAGANGVGQKLRLAKDVGHAQIKGTLVVRQSGETHIVGGS